MEEVKKYAIALVLLTSLLPMAEAAETNGVMATGIAKLKLTPDNANVGLAVKVRRKTAGDAITAINERANVLIGLLKQHVDTKQITTSAISLQAAHVFHSNREPEFVGYDGAYGVSVLITDLRVLGKLLDEVGKTDTTEIMGINMFVSDLDAKMDQARGEAAKNARKKAELTAGALGVKVGKPINIAESVSHSMPRPRGMYRESMMAGAPGGDPAPIMAGEQEHSVTVTVLFAIE